MQPQLALLRNARMLEEAGFGHSQALHDGAGTSVVHGGE